jgi:hypothetical protein
MLNKEKVKNLEAAERMWPELFTENESITLTNGEELINRYGKYQPNLTFLINEKNASMVWENVPKEININFDGDPLSLPGDYWVSKKGTHCFRPNPNGKHILVRVDWGGCFISSRGEEYEETKPLALFAKRASSNGGGTGYNFYIFDKNFRREVSIEDI